MKECVKIRYETEEEARKEAEELNRTTLDSSFLWRKCGYCKGWHIQRVKI
jgi:hypothetical protein